MPEFEISIDLDKMTLDDLEALNQAEDGEFRPFLEMLDRAATVKARDGELIPARKLPLAMIKDVVGQVNAAIMAVADEGN